MNNALINEDGYYRMDFSAYGDNKEVMHRLSQNANLVLDPGAKYGADGYVRACIPMPHSMLKEMFRRIYEEFHKWILKNYVIFTFKSD